MLYSPEFNYSNIEYISDPFWDFAYQTIDDCKKYLDQLTSLNTTEGWEASWNLTVDLGVIQSQLFGYYGKLIPNDTQESQEYLIYYLTDLVNTFDTEKQLAARALLAKISLLSGAYDAAIQECQYILNTNTFVLDPQALDNPESKEVIWGGYKENFSNPENPSGSYIHPILLREVYLMTAIAYSQTQREEEASRLKSILKEAFSIESTEWTDYINVLRGTGSAYPYYRLLNIPINQTGFISSTHYYLPIPKQAINDYDMTQNNGYN